MLKIHKNAAFCASCLTSAERFHFSTQAKYFQVFYRPSASLSLSPALYFFIPFVQVVSTHVREVPKKISRPEQAHAKYFLATCCPEAQVFYLPSSSSGNP